MFYWWAPQDCTSFHLVSAPTSCAARGHSRYLIVKASHAFQVSEGFSLSFQPYTTGKSFVESLFFLHKVLPEPNPISSPVAGGDSKETEADEP